MNISPIRVSVDSSQASSSSPSLQYSPNPSRLSVDVPGSAGPTQRQWRRRHSPSPSTHTHTAIDILGTPSRIVESGEDDGVVSGAKSPILGFLSVYRAHMMIMTVHCILAVDFPVFPRWLGKCENFGTSLVSCLDRLS